MLGGIIGSLGSALFGARQAEKQMDFQREMSNTQYQRAAKDLQMAGLNRILALGSPAGGASGAAAPTPDFAGAVTSAKAQSSIEKVNAEQAQLLRDQQEKTRAETEKTRLEAANLPLQGLFIGAQTRGIEAQIPGWQLVPEEKRAYISNMTAQLPKILAETRLANANASEAEFKKIFFDKAAPLLKQIADALIPANANSAGAVRSMRESAIEKVGDAMWYLFGEKSPEELQARKDAFRAYMNQKR